MIYASIIRAEDGWRALFAHKDIGPNYVDIRRWGIQFTDATKLIPLDFMNEDMTRKPNFVCVIDPNDRPSNVEVDRMCNEKLYWLSLSHSS